ncbi:YY1-associated factor 2-like [Petromyzon marinus]|uniref:YY1 associated factor 2 n=1 Tax=Petromyzon marinus TaxID=7757 RepID=S4R9H5_PETMA|nr:YY1-associated factor 2-like [Petromyzon marinus]
MGDKRSPTRPKRQAKALFEEAYWDCSVCTFRNRAEAFKCSICDVRKGTSTRKPRLNSQLVAQQVAQKFSVPTKKEKRERGEKEKLDKDREASSSTSKRNLNKKTRPKLKNIDRSSGQQLAVTVGNVTVIITDFKEKKPTAGAGAGASGPKGPSAGGAARGGSERGGSSSDSNTERDEPSHPTSPQRDESLSGDSH